MARRRIPVEDCTHPSNKQAGDLCTNEVWCADCGWLRDIMAWGSWDNAHADCPECS